MLIEDNLALVVSLNKCPARNCETVGRAGFPP